MKLPLRIHSSAAASGGPTVPRAPRGPRGPEARQRLSAGRGQGAAQRGSQAFRTAAASAGTLAEPADSGWESVPPATPASPAARAAAGPRPRKPAGAANFHCGMRGSSAQKVVGASGSGGAGGPGDARPPGPCVMAAAAGPSPTRRCAWRGGGPLAPCRSLPAPGPVMSSTRPSAQPRGAAPLGPRPLASRRLAGRLGKLRSADSDPAAREGAMFPTQGPGRDPPTSPA